MKLSEYLTKMTDLLKQEGDMDIIYRKDDEGNSYSKVEDSGYTGIANKSQMETNYEIECYNLDEASWLVENEYIESEDELTKVCIING
jgi:hypothetical protein